MPDISHAHAKEGSAHQKGVGCEVALDSNERIGVVVALDLQIGTQGPHSTRIDHCNSVSLFLQGTQNLLFFLPERVLVAIDAQDQGSAVLLAGRYLGEAKIRSLGVRS